MPQPPTVLLTADQIRVRVAQMANDIRRDFPTDLHLVGVLKGAFMFLADLARHIEGDVSLDFIAMSSYASGTTTSGEVKLLKDLDVVLDGRNVVIVDDVADTGLTLAYLQAMFRRRQPRSLRTACLLNKSSRRRTDAPIDYVGFDIADHFVVGYGLDHGESYRNLPYIAVLGI
jgi:hypoxanthine phosphoribosyltransferase